MRINNGILYRSVLATVAGLMVGTMGLTSASAASAAGSSTTATSLVADATAAGVKAAKDTYGVTVTTANQPDGNYRGPGYSWFVVVRKGSVGTAFAGVTETVTSAQDHAIRSAYARAAVASLKSAGLKLTATTHPDSMDAAFSLQSKKWACTVLAGRQTETECSSLATATSAISRVAPMAGAYAKAYPKWIKNSAFWLEWVHAGIKHYQRAEVGIGEVPASGGSLGYFAGTPKNAWILVQNTQDSLYCEYAEKTVTGSRAWAHTACYRQSTKKESTVRPR